MKGTDAASGGATTVAVRSAALRLSQRVSKAHAFCSAPATCTPFLFGFASSAPLWEARTSSNASCRAIEMNSPLARSRHAAKATSAVEVQIGQVQALLAVKGCAEPRACIAQPARVSVLDGSLSEQVRGQEHHTIPE